MFHNVLLLFHNAAVLHMRRYKVSNILHEGRKRSIPAEDNLSLDDHDKSSKSGFVSTISV